MLLIIKPLAYVFGTIRMLVSAIPTRLVVLEISFINITLRIHEPTFSVSSMILPLPLIHCAVWPLLYALTISLTVLHLSYIHSSCGKSESPLGHLTAFVSKIGFLLLNF